jgi:hypothetical protein
MHARILTTQSQPGLGIDPDDTVALWEDHLAAIFKEAQGFRSGAFDQVLSHVRDTLVLPPQVDGYDVIYSV